MSTSLIFGDKLVRQARDEHEHKELESQLTDRVEELSRWITGP